MDASEHDKQQRTGVAQAVGAYCIWGFMPVFFKLFEGVPAMEVVSHRVIWCVPLLLAILFLRGQLRNLRAALLDIKALRLLLLSAILIAANWLIYIFAVTHDHVVAASLGYFLNPLLNVLLGYLFLSERLGRVQLAAVAMAALGVAILATGALDTLWISIGLAVSFGFYGLVRKIAPVESLPGLTVETLLLAPFALGYAVWIAQTGPGTGWGSNAGMTGLLILSAGITAMPLLLFGSAARKIGYGTIGFIQYIGPSIQFLFAVLIYKESLNLSQIACFALIWSALALFSWDAWQRYRSGEAVKKAAARSLT
ncbi:EamA family transporter RarD [Sphingorhabdus arenilitoris]|uniref:EamA family transporter RarD n=1 Tax=Sphingorhabdus arenilitoris TaxID=1490041 RepID=A0ABV8RCV2_9SPHN